MPVCVYYDDNVMPMLCHCYATLCDLTTVLTVLVVKPDNTFGVLIAFFTGESRIFTFQVAYVAAADYALPPE